MNKTDQKASEESTPIVRQNLAVRMLQIRAKFPHIKMNQMKIARAVRCDQSTVSLAFRQPERVPGPAKKIEKYFDKFESQMQSKENQTAVV